MENEVSVNSTKSPRTRVRKRGHISISRKRLENKLKRMSGKEYVGFSSKEKKIKQNVTRHARTIKPACSSKYCKIRKELHCAKFDETTRCKIFESFWMLSWDSKQMFVQTSVKPTPIKNPKGKKKSSSKYYLFLNGEMFRVCRKMFLNTLDLKQDMVIGWIRNTPGVICQNEIASRRTKKSPSYNADQVSRKQNLIKYLNNLDLVDSHYCRKDTKKNYIAATFRSKMDVFRDYKKNCTHNKTTPVSVFTFATVFDQQNLAVFMPRKDQCDVCVGYKVSQISQQDYEVHLIKQKRAKQEKKFDKKAAINGRRHTFTMDTQAVKLAPDINASAIYYKTRLQTHNFTTYNLASRQCTNYWWDETEGDLSASSFISCIIHHLKNQCLGDTLPIVLFSDGCGYQNRNNFLSNALSNFAIKHNKIVEQKFLEKGHTQMECDSAHAKIEKVLEHRAIYIPSDYVEASREARKTVKINNSIINLPFDNEYLSHEFFKNYADPKVLRFCSIRPGSKAFDPTVNDIRAIIYLPSGAVKYKLDFDEEYRDFPRKIQMYKNVQPENLHSERLKIPQNKYKHLQELKNVIPAKYHQFYDDLEVDPQTVKAKIKKAKTEVNLKIVEKKSGKVKGKTVNKKVKKVATVKGKISKK